MIETLWKKEENTMSKSMTEGSPWKLILQFALPVIAGNIFQQFYNIMDSVIVGQLLGVNALAAVGSTYGLTFMTFGIVSGMTSGFGILIAQSFGAEDRKSLRHYTAMSIWLSVILAVLLSAVLIGVNRPVLRIMNTPDEIMDQTASYIGIIYGGLLFSFLYNMLASFARALGDSKTPLYFLVLSSVLNIVLDYVLIALFGMDVEGAAIATVFSQAVSAGLCIVYIWKKYRSLMPTREDWVFSGKSAGKMLRLGIPMALQFSLTAWGVLIVQSFLNVLGPIHIAGFSAGSKINNMITQIFSALGVAIATYVGQNKGANRLDRVKKGVWATQILVLVFSVVSAAAVLLFGDAIARLFVSEQIEEVLPVVREYLHMVIWFYPFLGTIFVYRNALQGLGFGVVPMLGGLFELAARIAACVLLADSFGYAGICFSDPCAWVSALIPLMPVYFYQMKKWNA